MPEVGRESRIQDRILGLGLGSKERVEFKACALRRSRANNLLSY